MHNIKVDAVPLADRIASISRQLSTDGARSFYELLDKAQGKIGVVVSFVAVLELIKRQLVGVVNADLASSPTADSGSENDSHIGPLTLQWLA
jgi:segregation and condensation protein A